MSWLRSFITGSAIVPPTARRPARAGLLVAAVLHPATVLPQAQNTYRFSTTLGNIDVTLRPDLSPRTVANFQSYADSGAYNSSIVHRAVPGFVIQGGGYTLSRDIISAIATRAPVAGEFNLPNTRGTIAMALSTGPNSATSEWFFNLTNNSSLLDATADGGPFTAFGQVCNSASLAVMDAIGSTENVDAYYLIGGGISGAFTELAVVNYSSGALNIPSIVIGNATYSDLVINVAHIVSGPTGSAPGSCGDSFNPSNQELNLPQVSVGSKAYFNLVATAGTRVSIGAVIGVAGGMPAVSVDRYTPASRQLLIPAVTYGGKVYTNVTVSVGSVISVGTRTG